VVAAAVEEEESGESDRDSRLMRPFQATLAWVVVGIAAVTALNGFLVSSDQAGLREKHEEFQKCVTKVVNQLSDALDARSAPQREATEYLDLFMGAVAEAFRNPQPDSRTKIQTATENYIEAREKANRARQQNPYPDPPRDVCQ
jgi:hypothetical protein